MEVVKARYKLDQAVKKRSRIKHSIIAVCFSFLLLAASTYGYFALSKIPPTLVVESVAPAVRQPDVVSMPWLGEGQAAIGSVEDGVLAVSTETEQSKPIASITKVITALAILNKDPENRNYTVTPTDVGYFQAYLNKGGSVIPVTAGQVLSRTEAFEALFLISANNIADSLVGWHFSSMQEYTDYANNMIKGFGLTHTIVTDASGFSPQTTSTPSELLVIAQKALAKPEIAQIVAMKEAAFPGVGSIKNTNRLLTEPGVLGIKTGTTDEAGHCLLYAAKHTLPSGKTVTLLGAVLGVPNSQTVFSNSKSLLQSAAANYQEIEILPAGTEVGILKSKWGQSTKLVTSEALKVEAWKGKTIEPKLMINEVDNHINSHEVIGKVSVSDQIKVDVISESSIGLPGNIWRLANYW